MWIHRPRARQAPPETSGSAGGFALADRKIHGTARHDGGDGVLVDHLGHGVAQQHNVLIERFDLALQLDAIDEIDGHRHVLATQGIEEGVLQKLTFVIAHDILRVQE